MSGLVVLTRPSDQSDALAETLKARGYAVLVEPMIEIEPLDTVLPPPDGYGALAFSSANAVSIFADRYPVRALAAYAVGDRTAGALRAAGFRNVHEASGDAQGLAQLIAARYRDSKPVLHVSGVAVARDLGAMLQPAGITVERVAVYDAVAAASLSDSLAEALYACTVSSVLFFSARTAQIFGTLVVKSRLQDSIEAVRALCLSQAVATGASVLPWRCITVAGRPNTEALLALLPPTGLDETDG